MRSLRNFAGVFVVVLGGVLSLNAYAAKQTAKEDYIPEPMPPGFQVIVADIEGPVFADERGRTLYQWPSRSLRNGVAGEVQGKPTCDDTVYQENLGFQSPYPGGFTLPELATRPSCVAEWPPVLAKADAKPTGKWTVIDRPDGRKQWAYEGWALYTSVIDKRPGDVFGASHMDPETDLGAHHGALRRLISPQSNVPSQFVVYTSMNGRSVELIDGRSVYFSDRDGRNKSNCSGACLDSWEPILAGDYAHVTGEWTTFERSPGVKQWAFRGKPVYRYLGDTRAHAQSGSDQPGWNIAYVQEAPPLPKGFTLKPTPLGLALGDERGMTLYRYKCTDDAPDQLNCDTPETPQVYRIAICGGGDAERCLKAFPYAVAPAGATTGTNVWGTTYINPHTGKRATAKDPGALNVWTYRGRPLYTFAGRKSYGDRTPDDANADKWGEMMGDRNGFKAIIYRSVSGY